MFFSSALAQAPGAAPQAPGIFESFIIPMALMFVVFYFLLIRPQQNARKKHQEMINNVKRGDTVVLAGGIVGKVTRASDGPEVQVEIAEGVQATVVKATISDVRSRTEPAEKKTEKK
jgi:preprotein translocase subunit YajC